MSRPHPQDKRDARPAVAVVVHPQQARPGRAACQLSRTRGPELSQADPLRHDLGGRQPRFHRGAVGQDPRRVITGLG